MENNVSIMEQQSRCEWRDNSVMHKQGRAVGRIHAKQETPSDEVWCHHLLAAELDEMVSILRKDLEMQIFHCLHLVTDG